MSKTKPDHHDFTDDRDLYSGLIRLHVLHHAAHEPIFGLGMVEELARHGYRISPGTLYPLLHGLEKKGYLRAVELRNGKSRRKVYRAAKQAVIKAGQYAYRDRRAKKRDFRALWIMRINAAARVHGLSYSRMIAGLHKAGLEIDRKMLADLAINDANAFGVIAGRAKAGLAAA